LETETEARGIIEKDIANARTLKGAVFEEVRKELRERRDAMRDLSVELKASSPVRGGLATLNHPYIGDAGGPAMKPELLLSLGYALLPGFAIFTLLYTVAVKLFEWQRLTFVQSLWISGIAVALLMALIVAGLFAKKSIGFGSDFESYLYIAVYLLTGLVITRLAKNHGIEKTGWLGLGGRANLAILVFGWVVVGIYLLVGYMK
jgi:hypothetical protein